MSDLLLKRLSDGSYDLDFDSVDLKTTEGLDNSIVLSLGSFARARSLDNVLTNVEPSIGGWWADSVDSSGSLGSNVYEAFPGRGDEATLKQLENLSKDALQWMIDDGVAKSVSVSAKTSDDEFVLSIKIEKPDGSESDFAYEINWENTGVV